MKMTVLLGSNNSKTRTFNILLHIISSAIEMKVKTCERRGCPIWAGSPHILIGNDGLSRGHHETNIL